MRSYLDQPSGTIDELRRLRRDAPAPERRLLRALREAYPHLKWRHQSPIGPFKPDILCFSEKLVIEVDGDTHAAAMGRDAQRTAFIEREGYRVIRFTNADVMGNTEGVVQQISFSLREKEGAAQRRKDEGDSSRKRDAAGSNSPSPSHAAARRGPLPLPQGEEN